MLYLCSVKLKHIICFKNQMKWLINELTSIDIKRMSKIEREMYKSDLEELLESFSKMVLEFTRYHRTNLVKKS